MILGVFFLLLGLSILIKVLFKIDIPVFRTFVALFLIYMGVRMLTGGAFDGLFKSKDQDHVVFSEARFKPEASDPAPAQYSIVFGKGTVDLTGLRDTQREVDIHVVFGECVVLIDPAIPVRIVSNAVFGEARMPDENRVVFGTLNYRTPPRPAGEKSAEPLSIKANVVFGSLKVISNQEPR